MNQDPKSSARPCGCDPGAQHLCEQHSPVIRFNTEVGDAHYWKDVYASPLPAPVRGSGLPTIAVARKQFPIGTGVLDYFPDALAVIANVSWVGNEQHNPGTPLHWDRAKSTDEADCLIRHFTQRGTLDTDGLRHTAKLAWRALALLQKELEGEKV